MIRFFSSPLLMGLVCFFCSAQPPLYFKVDHISYDQGLLNGMVNCQVQDSLGFIWIGTSHGLFRYDGVDMTRYVHRRSDSSSLRVNDINCLYVDTEGVLWVGTNQGGLAQYSYTTDSFRNFLHDDQNDNSLSYNVITCLTEDHENQLWIGTSQGLSVLNKETNVIRNFLEDTGSVSSMSIPNANILSLETDETGSVWIGCLNHDLSRYDPSTESFTHYRGDQITSISQVGTGINCLKYHDNRLYIGTSTDGTYVYHYFNENFERLDQAFHPRATRVTAIDTDQNGRIWIAGLSILIGYHPQTGKVQSITNSPTSSLSLPTGTLSSLLSDKQNLLWVGLEGHGLVRLSLENPFRFYTYLDGLGANDVSVIKEDYLGRIWTGYRGKMAEIFEFSSEGFTKVSTVRKMKHENSTVNAIGFDSIGGTWVATYKYGALYYPPDKPPVTYSASNVLSGNDVRDVLISKHGDIWLTIHGYGVNKISAVDGEIERFKENKIAGKSISNAWTTALAEDESGNIWVGSYDGLSRIEPSGHIRTFRKSGTHGQLGSNIIYDLLSEKNNLWIATSDGLSLYNKENGKLTLFNDEDGLISTNIKSIVLDYSNRYWVSTNYGICSFFYNSSDNMIEQVNHYTHADGLGTNQFSANAGAINSGGFVFFGSTEGMLVFHPDAITKNERKPPVYITDIRSQNKSLFGESGRKPISNQHPDLKLSENTISFQFVALNYDDTKRNEYAYRVLGLDQYEDWNYIGNRRNVTLANLQNGEYKFEVKASNNDGLWNCTPASLSFVIVSNFWSSAWGQALIFTFFGGAIFILAVFLTKPRKLHDFKTIPIFTKDTEKYDEHFLNELMDKIMDSIGEEDLNVPELAEKLGMTQSQLQRRVQVLTNKTIGQLMRSMKLNHAKELLVQNKLISVSEVAFKTGFKNPSNFTRAFTTHFGKSPTEIRNQLSKKRPILQETPLFNFE